MPLKAGKVVEFDSFVNEPAAKRARRVRFYKKGAEEAAKVKEESGFDELAALARKKNTQNFDDMISNLEEKYSKKGT